MTVCPHIDRKGRRCQRGAHVGGFHVYSPLAAIGRKRKRESASLDVARAAVKERSDGWCEAHELCDRDELDIPAARKAVCGTALLHTGVEAHHQFPEDRDAGLHDPERMLWLCGRSHDWAHAHPAAAAALGLLRPSTEGVH